MTARWLRRKRQIMFDLMSHHCELRGGKSPLYVHRVLIYPKHKLLRNNAAKASLPPLVSSQQGLSGSTLCNLSTTLTHKSIFVSR